MIMLAPFVILKALGSALSVFSFFKQGAAAKEAAQYNSMLSLEKAGQTRRATDINEKATRDNAARVVAGARTGYAKAGVRGGTMEDILASSVMKGELDALEVRYRGRLQETGFRRDAVMGRLSGEQAMRTGVAGAAASLLTGIGSYIGDMPAPSSGNSGTSAGSMGTTV